MAPVSDAGMVQVLPGPPAPTLLPHGRSVPSRSQMVREDRCGVHLQRKLSGEEITTSLFCAFTGSPAALRPTTVVDELRPATVVDDLVAWTES